MIKRQSLRCLSRQAGVAYRRTVLTNCWGVMALLHKDPFSSAGFHGFSRMGPSSSNELGAQFPCNIATDVVGSGSSPTSNRINAGNWLSLKGCSDGSASDGHGLHRRVDDRLRKPPRALAPLPFPQLLHYYSDARLEEDRNSTRPMMNGRETFQRRSPLGFLDRPLPEKLVVAVDVDEVLGSFVSALNKFIADRYALKHSVSEYHVYEFFKIWNCSRNEADIRVHEFFKTSYFKTGIHPIPGARVALHKLSTFCNLSVVTSRQNAIKDHTIEWIEKHYPGLFQEIHFGNHFALDGMSRPKSEICRSLGAHVLIDDNPRYAIECAEVGIRVLLFDYENSYPWCKTDSATLHPLVTKVHNWEEVEQQLVSWVMS